MIPASVRVDTARPGGNAGHLKLVCRPICQDAGGVQPVQHQCAVKRHCDDFSEIVLNPLDGVYRVDDLLIGQVLHCHAARNDGSSQQPMPHHALVQPQHIFAKPHGMGICHGKSGIRTNGADIGDMVVEPLQFLQ